MSRKASQARTEARFSGSFPEASYLGTEARFAGSFPEASYLGTETRFAAAQSVYAPERAQPSPAAYPAFGSSSRLKDRQPVVRNVGGAIRLLGPRARRRWPEDPPPVQRLRRRAPPGGREGGGERRAAGRRRRRQIGHATAPAAVGAVGAADAAARGVRAHQGRLCEARCAARPLSTIPRLGSATLVRLADGGGHSSLGRVGLSHRRHRTRAAAARGPAGRDLRGGAARPAEARSRPLVRERPRWTHFGLGEGRAAGGCVCRGVCRDLNTFV